MKSWNDITIKQFNQIKQLDLNDPEGQIRLLEVLLGIDLNDYPISQLKGLITDISFLNDPIPETIIKLVYDLNDTKYNCQPNISEMTVSQYMDYCSVSSGDDLIKILAIFLIPDGKNYGDYDIEQVYKDIETMSVVDAYAVFNFFKLQFVACYKTMEDFLDKQMKKGKLDKQLRKKVLEIMDSFCILDQ